MAVGRCQRAQRARDVAMSKSESSDGWHQHILRPPCVEIWLDKLPPSTNGLFLNAGHRGRIKTPRYRAWLTDAGWQLEKQKPLAMCGDIGVEISARRPDKRKRDIDNLAKPILDLLVTHRVIEDDSDIQRLFLNWTDGREGIVISVTGTLSGKPRK